MELRLTEQEALTLYRIILRWDESGSLTTEDDEERQLLFSLDTPGFSGFLPLSYPVCGP